MSPNTPHSRDNSEPRRKNGQREYRNYRQNQNRPRHPDKEVDERIRELDAERDPLSLPEEIVSEANKAGEKVGIPSIENNEKQPLNIAELQQNSLEELLTLAEGQGIDDLADMPRQELIFKILKHRMKADGLMYGEGTLEILPDGLGFSVVPSTTICRALMTFMCHRAKFDVSAYKQEAMWRVRFGPPRRMSVTLPCYELRQSIAMIP